ncbi:MAG: ImmA/IrrE family metallo-endopeptidase [Muribaculaceae bacterium]|nr:ImmA/IrrE family metallo-endopeptidase [Muribaculaceae bacterium]
MNAPIKQNVFNPVTLANTPGAELACIFEAHQILDYNARLGIIDLSRKEHLSNRLILKAEQILSMEGKLCEYLTRHEELYKQHKLESRQSFALAKKQFARLKPILPLLKDEFTDGYDVLNDLLDYFDADSPEEVFEQSEKQAAMFRKQNGAEPDPINLYGWLRRGELDYHRMNLPEYNESALHDWIDGREWESHLLDAAYFKRLPLILAGFGVGLSLVPHLPKTVFGAIRWIEDHPLIEISDRNYDLASCWFTLFHEFGHTLLHRNTAVLEGQINEKSANYNRMEREANKFANHYLFNGDDLRKAVFDRIKRGIPMTAKALAEEFGVNPMFASYWLLKGQYQPAFQLRYSISFAEAYQK